MPHLSPMKWTTMLPSAWILVSIIITKLHFSNYLLFPKTKNSTILSLTNWKWYQESNMNCKFMIGHKPLEYL